MEKILEKLKKIFENSAERGWKEIFYSAAVILTLSVWMWAFVNTAVFLTASFNEVIKKPESGEISGAVFDLPKFSLIAERLGLSFSLTGPSAAPQATPVPAQESPSPAPTPAEKTLSEREIKELSLLILNGTDVSGLAKIWQERFAAEGFKKVSVGNAETKNYLKITARLKFSARGAVSELRKIVSKYGAEIGAEEEISESAHDIVLIIGK